MDCFDLSYTFLTVSFHVSNLHTVLSVAVKGSPSGQRHDWSPQVFHCSLVVSGLRNNKELTRLISLFLGGFSVVFPGGVEQILSLSQQQPEHMKKMLARTYQKNSSLFPQIPLKQRQFILFYYIDQCIMVDL